MAEIEGIGESGQVEYARFNHHFRAHAPELPDFSAASVLVVGDVMLDRYWQG